MIRLLRVLCDLDRHLSAMRKVPYDDVFHVIQLWEREKELLRRKGCHLPTEILVSGVAEWL